MFFNMVVYFSLCWKLVIYVCVNGLAFDGLVWLNFNSFD